MLAIIFDAIRKLYQQKAFVPPIPVISIGNITLGGSGKTPLVYYLAEKLQPLYSKIAILSRGYGKITNNSFGKSLNLYDDEDFTYRYKNLIRIVNKNRIDGIQKAIEKGVKLAILDDGFQYHRIKKNIDILIINPFHRVFSSAVFPFGILREPLNSIKYADIIVINYFNFLTPEEKENILSKLKKYNRQKMYSMQYKIFSMVNVYNNKKIDVSSFSGSKALIFSGIGFPLGFTLLLQKYNIEIIERYNFRDHHNYTKKELEKIINNSSYPVITTEKDILRIPMDIISKSFNLFYPLLDIEIEEGFIYSIKKMLGN